MHYILPHILFLIHLIVYLSNLASILLLLLIRWGGYLMTSVMQISTSSGLLNHILMMLDSV